MNKIASVLVLATVLCLCGCSSQQSTASSPLISTAPDCSALSSTSLTHYDEISAKYLTDATSLPLTNDGGNVVFGTRYYLESLLTAYQATRNPKYLAAFVTSGNAVMKLMTTMVVHDAPVPINPQDTANAAALTVIGFPTRSQSFGVGFAIPTETGGVSMYVQDLQPTNPVAAVFIKITPIPGGGVLVSWLDSSEHELQSYTISNLTDLEGLAKLPLIEGQSYGRFQVTGQGMPKAGLYESIGIQQTIWVEQTGGILLPFARFLLLAKQDSTVADASTIATWTANVTAIAANYEDNLVSDGSGGLVLHNPRWLANPVADTDVAMDYMAVEGTLRILLYELTQDSHELTLARGLLHHQEKFNWTINDRGWFLLKYWPDFRPWTTRASAPPGSIWDEFDSDPTSPAPTFDAGFNVELLAAAHQYNLSADLGIPDQIYSADRTTLTQYLFLPNSSLSIIRAAYPTPNSGPNDSPDPSPTPFDSAGFLTPEITTETYINTNWNWMQQYETVESGDIAYFLRAWARSEAAELNLCQAATR